MRPAPLDLLSRRETELAVPRTRGYVLPGGARLILSEEAEMLYDA
jgi:hypothetical protein